MPLLWDANVGRRMKTIYLAGPVYTTLTVDIDPDGAEVAGYGEATDAVFALRLTDTERLLLAAALLRTGEHVERLADGVSELRRTKETGGKTDA